jgi:putative lipoic acid-binding regulatory protein
MIEKIKEIFTRVQKDIEKQDPKYPETFECKLIESSFEIALESNLLDTVKKQVPEEQVPTVFLMVVSRRAEQAQYDETSVIYQRALQQ